MAILAWARSIFSIALMGRFIGFRKKTPHYPWKILPHAVRYALDVQQGKLFAKDLSILSNAEYGYTAVLCYLVAKMLHGREEPQKRFLAEVSRCAIFGPETRGLVREWIARLDPDWSVAAAKLLQLNRQGFELWDDLYRDAFTQCAERKLPLVLVAYAPLIGFRWAVKLYRPIGREIFIISHLLGDDPAASYCGYRLWWQNGEPQIDFLDKSFLFPEAVILFEDTVKKGSTLRAVREFIESRRPDIHIEEIILNRLSPVSESALR